MTDLDEAQHWALLCERFHDIRQRAYAFGLERTWRTLAEAGPEAPGSLTGWLGLTRDIERLDRGQTDWGVRYGEDDAATGGSAENAGDEDWWEGWGGPGGLFECPRSRRCGRTAPQGLMRPRCWLSDREMSPSGGDGSPGERRG